MDYIIYTDEGFTLNPNGENIENCQILDFQYNSNLTKHECITKYLKENPNCKFNKERIKTAIRIDDETYKSINDIIKFIQNSNYDKNVISKQLEIIEKYFNI